MCCLRKPLIHYLFFSFSPSDLEADLEDNQDYDSAVSQSESSCPLSDQSAAMDGSHNHAGLPWSNQSKSSSYSATNFKPLVDQSSRSFHSGVSSYHTTALARQSSYDRDSQSDTHPSHPKSPYSPKSPRSANQVSNFGREPMKPVFSTVSRYQGQEESGGYSSRFNRGVRGPVGQQYVNKENKEDDLARRKLEKVKTMMTVQFS